MTLTYASYLQLDELLELQSPLSDRPEHDELLFIIIHQVYELWFKQILHEGDFLAGCLMEGKRSPALHTLRRILTILKLLVDQIDVLETMTPVEFLSFRDRLESASGFQSFQFREVEFLMGLKKRSALVHYPEGSAARLRLEARYHQPTLWDAFLRYLGLNGFAVPDGLLGRDVTQLPAPSTPMQALLLEIYHNHPATVRICERLVDLDEGFQEWRYRHIKMVERTIGNKRGTGGSAGVGYLATTLNNPFFPDLWAIRTEL